MSDTKAVNLHDTFDVSVWATEFCRLNSASDHGTMLGWFANAIMAGHDHAVRKALGRPASFGTEVSNGLKRIAELEQQLAARPAALDLSGLTRYEEDRSGGVRLNYAGEFVVLADVQALQASAQPVEEPKADADAQPTTAPEFLAQAAAIMAQRAAQYDQPGGERSMGRTVEAFNAIANHTLSEADGWLLLQVLKDVRQWQAPAFHRDSAEDGVAYSALKAEALARAVQPVDATMADLICWSSKKNFTLAQRSDADGNCPHCGAEYEIEDPAATIGSAPVDELAAIEIAAEAIYRKFDELFVRYLPWVNGGNSKMQDIARDYARAALAAKGGAK
ncbi:hypothetical protein ACFDR9_001602 [Janthinobacterium sp. CG_23.3]|uniref:hypothetical protein n=1 Tax=Janthinobacterium sp. CG_23.3 TaxID=3349634 RepID=UPI0038D3889D